MYAIRSYYGRSLDRIDDAVDVAGGRVDLEVGIADLDRRERHGQLGQRRPRTLASYNFV